MNGQDDVLGLAEIGKLAGVSRQAANNWRSRSDDFPKPAAELRQGPVFRRDQVLAWLEQHGKLKLTKDEGEGVPLGIESTLWAAADKFRGNLESSEYKHVVLGLVFLKYISDAFDERRDQLQKSLADPNSPEYIKNPDAREIILNSTDEYTAAGILWVPEEAQWSYLQENAKQPEIGKLIDVAMDAIEVENPSLRGVLPKDYARPAIDKRRLGELLDLISNIGFGESFDKERDVLGRVYEYFLGRFASAEGKGGGEFYTPRSVVRLLVEMIEPFEGRVYDPCHGSGGMFVQSVRFVQAHGGRKDQLSVYGQELTATTWRLSKMNLAIRGIEANLGDEPSDTFHNDKHPDLKADYILANPPFNVSDWGGDRLRDDPRWKFGRPPINNANFAWLQHIAHHLAPGGTGGVVLANGSLSSRQGGEGEIRQGMLEADLVDCIVALPPQLFYSVQIPVCLWFLARDKSNGRFRDRRREVLFVDARKMGELVSRVHRVLTDDDIQRISRAYHAWRGERAAGKYQDIAGFCAAIPTEQIAEHNYILTPGRYVGSEDFVDGDAVSKEGLQLLRDSLRREVEVARVLDEEVLEGLDSIAFRSDE